MCRIENIFILPICDHSLHWFLLLVAWREHWEVQQLKYKLFIIIKTKIYEEQELGIFFQSFSGIQIFNQIVLSPPIQTFILWTLLRSYWLEEHLFCRRKANKRRRRWLGHASNSSRRNLFSPRRRVPATCRSQTDWSS